MRVGLSLIVLALIGFVVFFFEATNAPSFRMATLKCQHDIIHETQGAVDYVVMGTSRTKQGVDPWIVSEHVGGNPVILNIARSWRGNGQSYHMIRDLLEAHVIMGAVIMEYSFMAYDDNRSNVYANGYYPNYELVTQTSDFLEDFHATPRDPYYLRIRDFFKKLVTQFDTRLSRYFDGDHMEQWSLFSGPTSQPMSGVKTATCFSRDNKFKPRVLKRRMSKFSDWRDGFGRGWDLDSINNDRHSYYIHKMRDLAIQHKFDFYLLLVPRLMEAKHSDAFISSIEDRYGVHVLTPENSVREKMFSEKGYTDITHMATEGRAVFSTWLGRELYERK